MNNPLNFELESARVPASYTNCVSIWGPKGGQGKSTIAVNLAEAAIRRLGLKACVICRDPQGTAVDLGNSDRVLTEVFTTVPESLEMYDLCVIDYPATFAGEPEGVVAVCPILPMMPDYLAYKKFAPAALANKQSITVINKMDDRVNAIGAFAKPLQQKGALTIHEAKAPFGDAYNELTTIFDPKMKRTPSSKRAIDELLFLLTSILSKFPSNKGVI